MTRECVRSAEMMLIWAKENDCVDVIKLNSKSEIMVPDGSLVKMLPVTKLGQKLVVRLSDSIEGSSRRDGCGNGSSCSVTVDLGLSAVPGDVAGLAATVARLSGSVQRTAVGCGAITGDVAC